MRILHVNDVARVGTVLVREAEKRGLEWDLYDTARVDPSWPKSEVAIRRAFRGAAWELGLAKRLVAADLIHVHGGTVYRHTRWCPLPMMLHLHGSDARRRRYESSTRSVVEAAMRRAVEVFYTTPDLREHVVDIRADARLHPVVIDVEPIPHCSSLQESAPIIFPSRWDSSKGGERLLEVVRAVRAEFPEQPIEGVDWGDLASAAADSGVTLRPKMRHEAYLQWLATARACVGQATGVMGASELEAMATDIPLVMPLNSAWYTGEHPSTRDVPVIGEPVDRLEDIPGSVAAGLRDLDDWSCPTNARAWVDSMHGPVAGVDSLVAAYTRWERA